jgi:membrane-associated protein
VGDPSSLLKTFGMLGLLFMVFAESGLLIGLVLPGDSLLFTAGLFASRGDLQLAIIMPGCFLAAVAGSQVGYEMGRRFGPALLRRPDSRFFRQDWVRRAEHFFADQGRRSVVLARFVPIIRTLTPVLAGMSKMPVQTFAVSNAVGALLWAIGVTLLGYVLGTSVPSIDRYLLPIVGVIVVASVVPALLHLRRARD